MKRTLLILAAMLGAMSAAAQDTVECLTGMPMGYLYDTTWDDIKVHYGFHVFAGPATGGEYAKRFIVDDTVPIYGIAASVVKRQTAPVYAVYDESNTNSIEYLRLYSSQYDTLCPIAEVPVHMGTTPISYYCHLDCPDHYSQSRKYAPMYELYFENPVSVCNSFYAGMTFFIERPYRDSTGRLWDFAAPPLALNYIGLPSGAGREWGIVRHLHHDEYGDYSVWGSGLDGQRYLMLFPIMTPEVDTTSLGTDLTPEQMLERYTGVLPNPAAGTAKVVSSFGLASVEAYNAAGSKVCDSPAAGYSATIDVSSWPAGTYILRIRTPMGTALKKLTVAR